MSKAHSSRLSIERNVTLSRSLQAPILSGWSKDTVILSCKVCTLHVHKISYYHVAIIIVCVKNIQHKGWVHGTSCTGCQDLFLDWKWIPPSCDSHMQRIRLVVREGTMQSNSLHRLREHSHKRGKSVSEAKVISAINAICIWKY